ncbi:hypothetical protein ROS62_04955 [Streptomyces sp. DSM 41972]|uniref:HNH endonuclease n=1 Tax=Streptomyces althioticus subsp. attaecolombicae TaxID=3075534 RepID=A0ABU3HXQ3_9ACTN|nr:hypothetical protein [Streptomyces sp. DSM 41972]
MINRSAERAYDKAQARVREYYGDPASAFLCTRCGDTAHTWALDHRAPNAILDYRGRRYSEEPHWYFPLCDRCESLYATMGPTAGPIFKRVSTFDVLPEPDWFADTFAHSDDSSTLGATAYSAYRVWSDAEGLSPSEVWSRRAFYARMEERGIARRKTSNGVVLLRLKLKSN